MSDKNENHLVSVVMITYGHENYIKEAIEGVLMQICNFEIKLIIADDKSPDNTEILVKNIIQNHPNGHWIEYIRHTENKGMISNFIWALRKAESKYIAFCEGDDYWTDPLKLQKQVNFLDENKEYGLIWSDVDFYIQSSGILKKAIFKNKIIPIRDSFIDVLINRAFLAPPTWLVRKQYLPKEINNYCDGSFPWLLDILVETRIKYLDEVTATCRMLDESASHSGSASKKYNFHKGIYRIQKDYLRKYTLSKKIEEEIDLKYYQVSYLYAVILGDKEEIKKGRHVLKNNLNTSRKGKIVLFLSNFLIGIYLLKYLYKVRSKYQFV